VATGLVVLGRGQRSAAPPPRPRPVYAAAQPLSSLVVEALDEGVIVVDAEDRIVLLNPAARAMSRVDVDRLTFPDLAELAGLAGYLAACLAAAAVAGWTATRPSLRRRRHTSASSS
jgi:PAS domain-containing protein